ncbi:glutamine amidotransferase-like class 1 domain-containing protein 1 [Dysidea avara]|uniref:glutamine amidotransferase-like class 1 domain-containing protein 1 n=1 Tax=Dysidea avara TaxID=196820 RepID=UPI003318C052
MATSNKPTCLIVLSAHHKGVSLQSFVHAYTVAMTPFNVFLATPQGGHPIYVGGDENSQRWIKDFKQQMVAVPEKLENVDATQFVALMIPNCPGAVFDLWNNDSMTNILEHFVSEKKSICAVGYGVCALFSGLAGNQKKTWCFKNYSMTAPSVVEAVQRDDFPVLPVVPADYIRENHGVYSASQDDKVHVVIHDNLITGQNDQSNLTAIQNLVLLCSQRQNKPTR